MSLGGRLSALKKKVDEVAKVIECESLIVGHDLYSLELYSKLKEMGKDVKIISPVEFPLDTIRPYGPSSIRGNANIEIFKKLFPEEELGTDYEVSLFFKDQKWRPFGGRSKSEKLLDGEEFYCSARTSYQWENLFSVSNKEKLELLANNVLYLIPLSISFSEEGWGLKLSAGVEVKAKKLFWGEAPTSFVDKFLQESKLPQGLFDYTDSTQSEGRYFIKLSFSEPIAEEKETLFVPLSYTHDWGHYIGEFDSQSSKDIEFLATLDLEQTSEDEVARRIKSLKRSLEKIYPASKDKIESEYISLFEKGVSTVIQDMPFNQSRENLPGLAFVGENAAIDTTFLSSICGEMELELSHVSHITRGILSVRQALVY